MDLNRLLDDFNYLITDLYEKQVSATRDGIYFKIYLGPKSLNNLNHSIASFLFFRNFISYNLFVPNSNSGSTLKSNLIFDHLYSYLKNDESPAYLVNSSHRLACYIMDEKINPTFYEPFLNFTPDEYYGHHRMGRNIKSFHTSPELIDHINDKRYFYIKFEAPTPFEITSDHINDLVKHLDGAYLGKIREEINKKFQYCNSDVQKELTKILTLTDKPHMGLKEVCSYYWAATHIYHKIINNRTDIMLSDKSYLLKNVKQLLKTNFNRFQSIEFSSNQREYTLHYKKMDSSVSLSRIR